MPQSDARLIQRVLQGDQDAFSALVKKYQKGAHKRLQCCLRRDR